MALSGVSGAPSAPPKVEPEATSAQTAPVEMERASSVPPAAPLESELRGQYQRDEYRDPVIEAGTTPLVQRQELPVALAVSLSKELGPEKFAQIQNVIFLANSTGPTSPQTLKALATLITENKGDFLKNLIPFMKAGGDLGAALQGKDASGQQLASGQRLWSFFKGLLGVAIDASTLGAGGSALAGLKHAYRATQAIGTAELATRFAPIIAELSKNGADPEVIAKLVELAQKPTLVDRMTKSMEAAVTDPAPPMSSRDTQNTGG